MNFATITLHLFAMSSLITISFVEKLKKFSETHVNFEYLAQIAHVPSIETMHDPFGV